MTRSTSPGTLALGVPVLKSELGESLDRRKNVWSTLLSEKMVHNRTDESMNEYYDTVSHEVSESFLRSLRLEIPVDRDGTGNAGAGLQIEAKVPKLAVSKQTVATLTAAVHAALEVSCQQLLESQSYELAAARGMKQLEYDLDRQDKSGESSNNNLLYNIFEHQKKKLEEAGQVGVPMPIFNWIGRWQVQTAMSPI